MYDYNVYSFSLQKRFVSHRSSIQVFQFNSFEPMSAKRSGYFTRSKKRIHGSITDIKSQTQLPTPAQLIQPQAQKEMPEPYLSPYDDEENEEGTVDNEDCDLSSTTHSNHNVQSAVYRDRCAQLLAKATTNFVPKQSAPKYQQHFNKLCTFFMFLFLF